MQLDPIKTQAQGGEKLKSRGMLNLGQNLLILRVMTLLLLLIVRSNGQREKEKKDRDNDKIWINGRKIES